jgi:two-component system LytT family response regulator
MKTSMANNKKIRALIVDDEHLARAMIRRMLDSEADFEIVGECENGAQAIAAIRQSAPDLVFLDVQMPGGDGFAVLEALDADRLPIIIFVTAYDKYAVKAFEVRALDYLLKPFDRERFEAALERAREHVHSGRRDDLSARLLDLLAETGARGGYLERLIIKTEGRIFFLKTEEIEWIEAEGNYVSLHVKKQKYLFREAISNLERQLDPRRFQRIQRSTIINLDFIRELHPWSRGDYKVILRDGTELKLSHRYKRNLDRHLGGTL